SVRSAVSVVSLWSRPRASNTEHSFGSAAVKQRVGDVSIELITFPLLSESQWLHEAHQLNCYTTHSWPYTTRVVQSSSAVPDNAWTMASHLLRPWRTCLAGLPGQAHDVDRLHTARPILVTR